MKSNCDRCWIDSDGLNNGALRDDDGNGIDKLNGIHAIRLPPEIFRQVIFLDTSGEEELILVQLHRQRPITNQGDNTLSFALRRTTPTWTKFANNYSSSGNLMIDNHSSRTRFQVKKIVYLSNQKATAV